MKCEPTASDALHGPHLRHPKLFLRRRNPTIMNKKFIHIALALSCALVCQAAEPGKSQKLGSPDQVPEGLEKSDWQGISQAYQASQFRSAKNAGLTTQQAYLKASNNEEVNGFGGSVAVSGDTVVVSAYVEDSPTTGVNRVPDQAAFNSGTASFSIAAYVFVRSGGTWSQQACLKTSDSEGGVLGGFGGFGGSGSSVAISGDTVVVGATEVAYVFVRTGDSWSQQADLKVSNPGEFDGFGASVAVSGDTVVVGAYGESSSTKGLNGNQANNRARNSGAAYVFTRSGGNWSQRAYLKASNTGPSDEFGGFVAISGSTIISGAIGEDSSTSGINTVPNDTGTANDSGAAYIFALPTQFQVNVKTDMKLGRVTGAGCFSEGRNVTLKATPKEGREFVGWFEKKKLVSKNKKLVIKNLTTNRVLEAKFK